MIMKNLYELEYDHEESLGVRILYAHEESLDVQTWSWGIFRS